MDLRHPPRRIAVVGSGVAGLTAAYVASRPANGAHVTLLEADGRLGGHADTHLVRDPTGRELHVDTGFIVHNRRTYPVLLRLFDELGVSTQESEMSLSTSDEETGLEWAGALGRRGLFPRGTGNHRNPAHLRMLVEIPRFHRSARRVLDGAATGGSSSGGTAEPITLGAFLDQAGLSAYFRRHFMEPLVSAVWSCDPAAALDYPAAYLFAFLEHHGMLQVRGSPTWRTVTGGACTYVDRVAAAIREAGGEVRTGCPVTSVIETPGGVEVTTPSGREEYDAVVLATHPDQALAVLAGATAVQKDVLDALPYQQNTALLHTDTRLLPAARDAWASWNFRRPRASTDRVLVTYDLTRLQRLPTDTRYLLTLGGEDLVDPATVRARRRYAHPRYTPASVAARARLPEVDSDRVVLAGAYHGWGFHEDGARSGLRAVKRLGLRRRGGRAATVTRRHAVVQELADRTGVAAARGLVTAAEGLLDHRAATAYRTVLVHTRREPVRNRFRIRSRLWVVDLDRIGADGSARGGRGRFLGRDHFDGDTDSVREGLDRYLARHGIDLRGGRALMAAHPRAFGHCFNPITVHWCWADREGTGRPAATVVEVHNTYGDRHAYLLDPDHAEHPDSSGRARVAKAMYVSPFHGVDGHYEVLAPPPDPATGRLRLGVRLVTGDGARFDATLDGRPGPAPRLPLAGLRGAALIRLHGVALWARRLRVRPRPSYHAPTGGDLR